MRERDPLSALGRVFRSVEAVRNTRALGVLLGTFATAGLLVSMAEAALARGAGWAGPIEAVAALVVAFYGGSAAGILVMDDARGRSVREVGAALRTALATAHRLLLVLTAVAVLCALGALVLFGLLWLCRPAVSGVVVGPLLFGVVLPIGVLAVGGGALAVVAVVVPLAAPAVWAGMGVAGALLELLGLVRGRLPSVALLMAAVSVVTAGVGALAAFVVMVGGRVVAQLGVAWVGLDVPAEGLMAGLYGYGLRSIGAAGLPAEATGHANAALVGGGVVFALALVLPGLVYLRGTCAVYLAMAGAPASRA